MPNRTNTRPLHAGTEEISSNYCRGQRFNTLVKCSYYSVRHAEIRTWDNEISVHLVITRSSQPETKGDGPVVSIDSRGLLLATLLSSSPPSEGYQRKPRVSTQAGLEKSFALSLSALKVITFPHTPYVCSAKKNLIDIKGSIQQKFSVYGGAHLTANVLKSDRNLVTFLYVIVRQLWNCISFIICRLFYYLCQRKRWCDSRSLFVWLWTK